MRVAVLKCHDELNALYNIDGKNVDQDELLCIRISKILKKPVESFVVSNDDFPEGKFDAYVISGSNKNPDRESIANTPWMRELLSFIRIHHENKVPMLGICFGHQMMAVAFGAKAYKLPEYEIG